MQHNFKAFLLQSPRVPGFILSSGYGMCAVSVHVLPFVGVGFHWVCQFPYQKFQ